jgi:hypothetical protein
MRAAVRRATKITSLCQRGPMPSALRRALAGLASLVLGVVGVVVLPATAHAREVNHYKVGVISGEYWVAGKRYDGEFYPSRINACVKVQRKAAGVWRNNVIMTTGAEGHCREGYPETWYIGDDTLALNTEAIRLIVVSGDYTGSYVVLCSSKSDCQQT